MKVPQSQPFLGPEEYAVMKDCFENNWITEGPTSEEFMHRMRELTGAKHAVLAPNGTLALYLGLRALGIGPGDEVIVPDFTFIASATAVEMTGATPVFCDVDYTLHMNVRDAERVLTAKTKAVMPVHIFGGTAAMEHVVPFAREHNLLMIEDACQAVGINHNGRHCGTFGDIGIFSFFCDKTITTGEGGMVITDNPILYDKLRYLRNQGRLDRGSFEHPEIGYNFRTTDLNTAIGIEQLKKLPNIIHRKQFIFKAYEKNLDELVRKGVLDMVLIHDKTKPYIPFRVPIMVDNAKKLMAFLETKEIQTRQFFYPMHKQPCFQYLKRQGHELDDRLFPIATKVASRGVCLPCFPALTVHQVKYVCDMIKEFFDVQ